MWQNSKTLNSDKTQKESCDKTQNSKTEIATKLENWNCDKTKKSKLWKIKRKKTLVLTNKKKN